MKLKCVETYEELYHQEPFDVAFCPYRISPLGAHIDHQYGKINGLAIDKGIHMAYHPKQNGIVELQSLNFSKRAQFFVNAVPDEKQGDWADHLRGADKMLGEKYRLKIGLSCGKLDQSCEVLSKRNHLLYLDTKDDSYELIPTSEAMKPYKIGNFFSGLDYGTFAEARLRDVPYEVFMAYKNRLPELWCRRAEHFYSEFAGRRKAQNRGAKEIWRDMDS